MKRLLTCMLGLALFTTTTVTVYGLNPPEKEAKKKSGKKKPKKKSTKQ